MKSSSTKIINSLIKDRASITIEEIDRVKFEKMFSHSERELVCSAHTLVVNEFFSTTNTNFFSDPSIYEPYLKYFDIPNFKLPVKKDLSRPAMSSLYFLNNIVKGEHRVLDYACGISGFLVYASKKFPTKGFDRWVQISKEACEKFLIQNNLDPNSIIIDFEEISSFQPTILNVSGFWVEDIELYNLDSLEYVLSDPLYNSGAIPNEGCYFYNKYFENFPEKFGFSLLKRFPYLDVYRKC